jgi:hypothetical protein
MITSLDQTLFFAWNLLGLKEDPKGFEKFCHRIRQNRTRESWSEDRWQKHFKQTEIWNKNNPEQRKKIARKSAAEIRGPATRVPLTPEERKQYRRDYENIRRRTDLNWKIKKYVTTDILQALKRTKSKKHVRTVALLGCSIEEFKQKIASQFTAAMSWKNHGPVWHLDHIRPKRSFDLNDPAQQAQCFHWSNWQSLSAFENQSKGAKWNGVDWRFQDA